MFITFEGCDGSGKTTQVEMLKQSLEAKGFRVQKVREPAGNLREIALAKWHAQETSAFLFMAARAEHVARVIRPMLSRGNVVLCDRFCDSTIAYQSYGHGLDLEMITKACEYSALGLVPDATFFLDIDPEDCLDRRNGMENNWIDNEPIEFHKSVYQGYRKIAMGDPCRIWSVEADRTERKIHQEILSITLQKLDVR